MEVVFIFLPYLFFLRKNVTELKLLLQQIKLRETESKEIEEEIFRER